SFHYKLKVSNFSIHTNRQQPSIYMASEKNIFLNKNIFIFKSFFPSFLIITFAEEKIVSKDNHIIPTV
ncbi:hypothetical protein ABG835_07900, partial [Phocaeicola vulgatus]